MHLYIEYFRADSAARRNEVQEAIHANLNAPFVSKLTLFAEDEPPPMPRTHVVVEVIRGPRQTYQSIIDYANQLTGPTEIHAIVNNDISLSRGFDQLASKMAQDDFIALTRHELSGVFDVYPPVSQDVWLWRGPCRIENGHFFMGVRGCDNRIAAEAYLCGYSLSNPCRNLVAFHHHRSQIRGDAYHEKYVDPPYVSVAPCFLGQTSRLERMVGGEQWVAEHLDRVDARPKTLVEQVRSRLKA